MAISYQDYKNKYGSKIKEYQDIYNELKKSSSQSYSSSSSNSNFSSSELSKVYNKAKENENTTKSTLKSYLTSNGVTTNDDSSYSTPNLLTIRTNNLKESLSGTRSLLEDDAKTVTNLPKAETSNVQKYQELVSNDYGKDLVSNVKQAKNESTIAKSNYEVKKAEEDYSEASNLKKAGLIGSSLLRGGMDLIFKNDNSVQDDNGVIYTVPNYREALNSQISQNSNIVGRIVNDVGYQAGKVITSSALNTIAPGLGTSLYYEDIFDTNYNQTLREGYSQNQATAYALLSTATEVATEKILGASVGLFSEKSSVEELASSVLKNVIKSEKVNTIISSAIAEGNEEFVQEFIDVFERNLTLGESNKITKETFENAIYSGIVGALSSGVSEGARQVMQPEITSKFNQVVYDIERTNKITLDEESKQKINELILKDYIANDGIVDINNVIKNYYNETGINENINEVNSNISEDVENTITNNVTEVNQNNEVKNLHERIEELENELKNNNYTSEEKTNIQNEINTFNNQLNTNENTNENYANSENLQDNLSIIKSNLQNRISGDDLLNTIDFIEELKTVGANIDDNGYVTVYHQTTKENADNIIKTGKMSAKEDGIFFSTSKNAQQSEGRGTVKLEFKIPAEQLVVDDIFDDNADVKIPLSSNKKIYDVSNYLQKNASSNNAIMENIDAPYASVDNVNLPSLNTNNENKINQQSDIYNLKQDNAQLRIDLNYTIDKIYEGIMPKGNQLIFTDVPQVLNDIGVKDFPTFASPNTIRNSVLTKEEAQNLGYPTNKNENYHGLGKEGFNEVLNDLSDPVAIIKENPNKIVVLTEQFDYKNNQIIVPIEINSTTHYNTMRLDANVILSAHGRKSINNYLNNLLSKNGEIVYKNAKKIQSLKDSRKVQYPESIGFVYDSNITQSNENVKLPINKDMQNTQNNTTSYSNLTSEEIEELNTLKITDDAFGLNEEEQKRYDYLENRSNGLVKFSDLKNNITYEDIKTEYATYKDLSNFDSSLVEKAESFISDYRNTGKRTKEQWLSIAKFIGNNIETDSSEELTKYAIQSWFYTKPNTKDTLNRQGKSYVKFTVDEWVNAVYNGAGVGTVSSNAQKTTPTLKIPINKNSDNTQTVQNNQNSEVKLPTYNDINITSSNDSSNTKTKTLDPIEISNLTQEDANTTPKLPKVERNKVGDGESNYFSNIRDKTNMLNQQQKTTIMSEEEVQYYDKVTNKESLEKAFDRLNKNGADEALSWVNKKFEDTTPNAVDVAEGWILLKQYADNNDTDNMVAVAKQMRYIGTKAGQTVQAFNIMERMTPEGMVKYAQSELSEAYDKMVKNKTKEWIEKYRSNFDLTSDEVQFIMDNMKEVSTMEDGYNKRVKLAEIQKIMTDKLPPTKGNSIKSWMRISMLFNPKTQVRNVAGNAFIMPVNYFGDMFSSYADKIIAKKTGVRTTGNMNVKAILEGFKKGAYEATNDYKKGINTKNMEGNRFEIGEGKSFTEKTLIGKTLNRTESLLNYVMDVGDRVFSESSFENSLQNQMILNNTTEVTQEMIDIATQESLSRTWNDNNNYTSFVLGVRKGLNKIGIDGYGLGDVLIPFAKTPANLTKAIVDYSPVGLVNTLIEGNNLRKSLTNGQYTASMQHRFVQDLGKATAGTMLYVAGYALAKANITSGESDDDKDVSNFLKNTLGISSYSIKIGNKSFTYDWAQPIAAPLSIMANVVNSKNKETALLEAVVGSLDTAGSILLEQSFLDSINDVLSDNDGIASGIINEILELPSRAVPTLSKQIVDLTDSTQRTAYEYGKPIKTAINNIKAKIPGLSKTLSPSVDTMGREVQRYGGKNNIFNVFLNPANVNTENISDSAKEIYRLYKETGDSTIMPRVVPYYINQNGEKVILTNEEKANYQKISGSIIEENVENLINSSEYKKLDDTEKSSLVKSIVDYAYNKAKKEVLDIDMSSTYNKVNEYVNNGGTVSDYYLNKDEINYSLENPGKYSVITQITDYKKYQTYKEELQSIRESSDNKKTDTINYINSLSLSIPQKAMFIRMYYSSYDNYNSKIVEYVNNQNLSVDEKSTILKELGFEIKNGKVYW